MLRDHRVHKDRLASQDSKAPLDLKVKLVLRVHSQDPLAVQVQPDLRDLRATLATQDRRVAQGPVDRLDHKVQPDLRGLLVQVDRLGLQDSKEEQELQGHLDNKETPARRVLLDR